MVQARIVLAGACPKLSGQRWESERPVRLGREGNVDITLEHPSVGRQHAEIYPNGTHWLLRDLARSDLHPTLLNGVRLGRSEYRVQRGDVVQCGQMSLVIDELQAAPEPAPPPLPPPPGRAKRDSLRLSGNSVQVQKISHKSWDEAMQTVTGLAGGPGPSRPLLALLRAGQHLRHISNLDELLTSVLADAIGALNAQRGSIFLLDPASGNLRQRTYLAPRLSSSLGRWASTTLAERCFASGESVLCRDTADEADLVSAMSVQRGAMASMICAVLRSPRKRLGVLQLDRGPLHEPFTEDDFHLADAVAANVALGIESALLVEEQRDQFIQTVTSLARTVEVRDQYTGDHTRRVTEYALLLADQLAITPGEREQLAIGTPLHDIGKIGITDAILRKPGKLTPAEFQIMQTHTVLGANILESLLSLSKVIPIVRHHHERWDGTGYPDRLAGQGIARVARIVAVADAFDAMTSTRPYRQALPTERGFSELLSHSGTHFDPECVAAFLRVRERVEQILFDSLEKK